MFTPLRSPLDGCRLWCIDLDAPLSAARRAWLSAAEQARAARFVFEHDRRRYQAAHAGLRELIAQDLAMDDPAALAFTEGEHGKPMLAGRADWHFNLSHSGRFGLVAFAAVPVGVDVEVLRPMPDAEALASAHFTGNELGALRMHGAGADRDRAFLQGWTRKEACLKAIGAGLTLDTRAIEVGIGTGRNDVALTYDGAGPLRLRLSSVPTDDGMVVAVALVQRAAAPSGAHLARPLETCA